MEITFKAINPGGQIAQGKIEAKNVKEAANALRQRNFVPITLREKKQGLFMLPFAFLNRPSFSQLVFFTRQLSQMISAGLTLVQALYVLKEQMTNEGFRTILSNITRDVEEGRTFSSAIERYPAMFSPVYIATVRAGESSGLFDKVFSKLADNIEKQQDLRNSVRSAMVYPAIVIVGVIIVVMIMMLFVVPQFSRIYEGMNIEMPLPTVIVISISNFFIAGWPIIFVFLSVGIFAFFRFRKTQTGKKFIDYVLLKMPVVGNLQRQLMVAEFSTSLGLMVGTGNLLIDSLRKSADVTGNIYFHNALVGVSEAVEKGISISNAMKVYEYFPPMLVQSVKIGEETGKLDEALLRVSRYYEGEVDRSVKTLVTLLEPMLIVVLGLVVAFIILSVITPIYSLLNHI